MKILICIEFHVCKNRIEWDISSKSRWMLVLLSHNWRRTIGNVFFSFSFFFILISLGGAPVYCRRIKVFILRNENERKSRSSYGTCQPRIIDSDARSFIIVCLFFLQFNRFLMTHAKSLYSQLFIELKFEQCEE